MFDMIEAKSDKDLSNDRTMKLNNNMVHVYKQDPYGFWFVKLEKGQIPDKLKGAFTSFYEAEKAVTYYYRDEKGRQVKETTM